jgi:hypothetical protein
MLTRRAFTAILALPLVARADSSKPEFWSGHTIEKAQKGSILVDGKHVRLRNKFTPRETTMISQANDNSQFMLWVVADKQHGSDFQYLKIGSSWWTTNGTGSDSEGTKTTFHFDRATAKTVAAALKLALHERTKLDDDLRYSWKIPSSAPMDKTIPIPVVVRIENTGKKPVGFFVGGRQRGPRDNRFIYVIKRNGTPVKIKDGPDFGGIGSYQKIEPGKHLEVTCTDLRAWFDFDLPGFYTIEARHESTLSKNGMFPNTAAEQAQVWDVAALGQGAIHVK